MDSVDDTDAGPEAPHGGTMTTPSHCITVEPLDLPTHVCLKLPSGDVRYYVLRYTRAGKLALVRDEFRTPARPSNKN